MFEVLHYYYLHLVVPKTVYSLQIALILPLLQANAFMKLNLRLICPELK